MADHRADQIVAAVVTNLNGLTTTKQNVFRGRDNSPEEDELPCLIVNYGEKVPLSEIGADNIAFIDVYLDIIVEIKVRKSSGTDILINKISKEVYIAMMADRQQGLSSFVFTTQWRGDSSPDISPEGNQEITTMVVDWAIKYRHSIGDPSQ